MPLGRTLPKDGKDPTIMLKRLLLTLAIALQFTAATSIATADVDIPYCYPCEGK